VKTENKKIQLRAANDTSTEEKIKEAARKIFLHRGYAATRTRDIAEEAGLNLALLNYYFRSKEKLFDIIMMENLQHFIEGIKDILNDNRTSLEQKIEAIVNNYINLLMHQPELPLFVLHELRSHPKELVSKIDRDKFINRSYFMQQLKEAMNQGKVAAINPLHFLMNIVSLTIFPFVASPILRNIGGLKQQEFNMLMEERKKLIPVWIKTMMKKNK
jgi:AcrR family transcriptional regulator